MNTNQILPVAVFGFNRPGKLARVLNALRPQKIDRLIIFIDGPRTERDSPHVHACRDLAKKVDWTRTDLYFHKSNHGLTGIQENITTVLQDYPKAVFVEDDCLLS